MKAVMYHYVRESEPDLPSFRYLHAEDFASQLDFFAQEYGIISRTQFHESLRTGIPAQGMVLTFDDGVIDHYRYVYPLLKERGLWGIFYVPSGPYHRHTLLDVHRVHMLLGRLGGEALLAALEAQITPDMLIEGSEKFSATTYTTQQNDDATTRAKQLINYYVKPECKEALLASLMQSTFGDEAALTSRFYINAAQMREMAENGMSIGSHGDSHTLMSHLDYAQQKHEITHSFGFLEEICGEKLEKSFCYPYGGDQSFTRETTEILADYGTEYAFSVYPADIETADLKEKYRLPRYDCNIFPHGKARLG
jgi:peptidoglycan/xylan/chitin deacetylase (PgdA/CDA1 family)